MMRPVKIAPFGAKLFAGPCTLFESLAVTTSPAAAVGGCMGAVSSSLSRAAKVGGNSAGRSAFAASGTSLVTQGTKEAWFGTGGPGGARVFRTGDGGRTWDVAKTPLGGTKSAGI